MGISHKNYAVSAFEDRDTCLLVQYLTWSRVGLEANLEAVNLAEFKRKQIEIKSSLGLSINRDHVSYVLWVDCLVYIMQVGGFTAQPNAIIDNLTVDFSSGHID